MQKQRTSINPFFFLAAAILSSLLLLTACTSGPKPAETPEDAVMLQFKQEAKQSKQKIDLETYHFQQLQETSGTAFVLFSYQYLNQDGSRTQCLSHRGVRNNGKGWVASGGGSWCLPVDEVVSSADHRPMMGYIGGGKIPFDGELFSYNQVSGFVYEPNIRTVEAVWGDGEAWRSDVINYTYFIVHSPNSPCVELRGLDQNGTIIFKETYE